jgi:hypothetical protein
MGTPVASDTSMALMVGVVSFTSDEDSLFGDVDAGVLLGLSRDSPFKVEHVVGQVLPLDSHVLSGVEFLVDAARLILTINLITVSPGSS